MLQNPVIYKSGGGSTRVTVTADDYQQIYGGFIEYWDDQTEAFVRLYWDGTGSTKTISVPAGAELFCCAYGSDSLTFAWSCSPSSAADVVTLDFSDSQAGEDYHSPYDMKIYRVNADCSLTIEFA